ncbi:MAG TPA: type IV secretion system DNA-binding domain-containing protein [Candidatus Obscuribacterales bacterium]
MPPKEKPLPLAVLSAKQQPAQKVLHTTPGEGVHLGEGVYWNPRKLPNPHLAIIGASGSGKTQTLKAIAHELHTTTDCNIILVDFHGDQALQGEQCYEFHMASSHGINPLEINLDPKGGGCNLQAIAVAATLKRALQMGVNQEGLLLLIFQHCYKQRGITQEDPASWMKPAPNFKDVEAVINQRTEDGCKESKKLQLKLAATFQYGVFNKKQPDLYANKLTRLDFSKLPPELGAIASEAVLKQLMDSHRLKGETDQQRTFAFIDEVKELKNSPTIDRIFDDGRKYGLGAAVASQSEQHFSKEILLNAATKIVLAVDQTEVKKVSSKFRFDEKRVAVLQPLQALVRLGATAAFVHIKPYYQRIGS